MSTETLIKCMHPSCQCLVEAEQMFCSSACASAKGANRGPCMCGHPGCTGEHTSTTQEDEFDPLLPAE